MARKPAFRDNMKTAPMDGRAMEVRCGLNQETVLAGWSAQNQCWVQLGDLRPRVLHWVTAWRPIVATATKR